MREDKRGTGGFGMAKRKHKKNGYLKSFVP